MRYKNGGVFWFRKRERERERERSTLFDGLFVVADVVDGGGDFPVERAADVEEDEE